MSAPVASGWSGRRVGLAPTGKAPPCHGARGTQTLIASGRAGRGERWEHLVIKEDEAARFRERLKRSAWSGRLIETELFQKLETALPTFATQLQAIAMRAEERVAEARRVLPIQR